MVHFGTNKAKAISRALLARKLARVAAAEVVPDIDAFMKGHLAETLEWRGHQVPVWAWTNLLAHAGPGELEADSYAGSDRADVWRQARSYLAGEVLRLAGPQDLHQLQQAVLVPLELRLASCPGAARWKPVQWAHEVLSALQPVAACASAHHTPPPSAHPAGHRS